MLYCSLAFTANAQEQPHPDLEHIYNPAADAAADLAAIQQQATAAHKHILLQVGGNWCIWCKRFYKLTEEDSTLKSLLDAVRKFGLEVVGDIHVPFNAELHQAMTLMESEDLAPNHVIMVMQKGYTLNGRLLRPAMVAVSKAKA